MILADVEVVVGLEGLEGLEEGFCLTWEDILAKSGGRGGPEDDSKVRWKCQEVIDPQTTWLQSSCLEKSGDSESRNFFFLEVPHTPGATVLPAGFHPASIVLGTSPILDTFRQTDLSLRSYNLAVSQCLR